MKEYKEDGDGVGPLLPSAGIALVGTGDHATALMQAQIASTQVGTGPSGVDPEILIWRPTWRALPAPCRCLSTPRGAPWCMRRQNLLQERQERRRTWWPSMESGASLWAQRPGAYRGLRRPQEEDETQLRLGCGCNSLL
jgi:hypothetical protein